MKPTRPPELNAELERAKVAGYYDVPFSVEHSRAAILAYCRWCREVDRPPVVIQPSGDGLSAIWLEMFWCSWGLSPEAAAQADALLKAAAHLPGGGVVRPWSGRHQADGVPRADAPRAALGLAAIAECCRPAPAVDIAPSRDAAADSPERLRRPRRRGRGADSQA